MIVGAEGDGYKLRKKVTEEKRGVQKGNKRIGIGKH